MATVRLKNSVEKDKAPTAAVLQLGELAVNAHEDSPAVYFKDKKDVVHKLTADAAANDGAIKISAKKDGGIVATGDDASANQATETEKVLSVDTTWLNTWITTNIDGAGIVPGNGDIEIAGGDGIKASGDNAKANQATKTTRTLAVDTEWLSLWLGTELGKGTGEDGSGPPLVGNGEIKISALKDGGITATGTDATANQHGKTDKVLSVDSTVIRTTGNQSMADTKTFSGTIGLTNKSVIQIESLPSLPED